MYGSHHEGLQVDWQRSILLSQEPIARRLPRDVSLTESVLIIGSYDASCTEHHSGWTVAINIARRSHILELNH